MDFSNELSAHEKIHAALDTVIAAIEEAKKDHSKFKPDELRELVEKLKEPLVRLSTSLCTIHGLPLHCSSTLVRTLGCGS